MIFYAKMPKSNGLSFSGDLLYFPVLGVSSSNGLMDNQYWQKAAQNKTLYMNQVKEKNYFNMNANPYKNKKH